MRIAHVAPVATTCPPPKAGSVELVSSLLTEGLVERGHDVTFFATADSVTKEKLHSVFPHGYWHDEDMWPWEFCEMLNLSAVCERAHEFDVIHYQAAYYPMSLAFIRLIRTPVLQTIHHHPDESQIKLWSRYPEANFVAISHFQAEAMEGLNRLGVVYNGINTASFTFRPDPENYLLFLGRFTAEKGAMEAIEVAKRLGIRLLMAAPDDEYYREVIAPHVDGQTVEYVGEVDHTDKDRLLGGARALLYPVQVGEPFGLVMVEAMACGTPVVALDKGAVGEIVLNGINGYRVATLDEMVSSVPRACELNRADVRHTAVNRFDAEQMVDGYINVYEQMISTQYEEAGFIEHEYALQPR
jgi:glycosyltransferase involved in cell wall biosynthesis